MIKVKTPKFLQLNILITPESTPSHRSEKRPKKLPASDFPKIYSIPKLSIPKRSKKLSFTTGEKKENFSEEFSEENFKKIKDSTTVETDPSQSARKLALIFGVSKQTILTHLAQISKVKKLDISLDVCITFQAYFYQNIL